MTELPLPQKHRANAVVPINPAILATQTVHWRQDLNRVLSSIERSSVDAPSRLYNSTLVIEHARRAVTHVLTMTKPFDVLA